MTKNLILSFLFCILCINVYAQQHDIDTVYVEANARLRMMRSTAPVQVLEHADIRKLGVSDVADALHRMPGINLRDYGGAGGMKTVAVRGFGAQHTGVSYDGILLSECQGGEIDVSRYSIDQVKALRLSVGDNEDIFITARQASVPALLSIETMEEEPVDERVHLATQLKYGSFGLVSPFLRYTQQLSQGFTLSAMGEYTYAENDYPFILQNGKLKTKERRSNSRMNSGHGELNSHWRVNPCNQIWAKLYYYDNDRRLPGIVRYYTNLSAETLHERNFFGQMRWIMRSINDKWMLKVNAKYNWASSVYTDSLVANRLNDASYWQREYYASASLMWLADEHWSLDYSADYAFNNLNSTLTSDQRPRRQSILQSMTAKFVGGKSGRWVGLVRCLASVYRQDVKQGEGARNFQRLSPSLSLSYHLLDLRRCSVYLRASYKDIFRVPTFNENYFFHYGSTDLDAEKTQQWNVGMTWNQQWSPMFTMQMTVDGYINKVRDKIVGVPYNMFVWRMVNLGKVDVEGLDVSWRASFHQLTFSASYSCQRVVNHTDKSSVNYGKQVAYIPLHSGSMSIGWENPWINLSLHGTGMSDRWASNNHYEGSGIAGYCDVGVTAYRTFRIAKNLLEVRADVKNLFNKQYEIVANYPMPRRSWLLGISYKM